VVLLSAPGANAPATARDLLTAIHANWLTLRGAQEATRGLPLEPVRGWPYSLRGNVGYLLDLIGAERLQVGPLLSHVIQPEGLPEAYAGLRARPDEYLSVVVDWRGY
jgi:threonine dehydrogenase-like Zn-dependent dehydrogenase